ncbi:MAG: IS1634 family transposase, partial [Actinomycetota bacterium]|nr:IS1634 family transposase [Actinomycetota bacterium]
MDKLGLDNIRNLGNGLLKAAGVVPQEGVQPQLLNARHFGHVHVAQRVWEALGLSQALEDAGIAGAASFPVVEFVRLLVINRLCDPCSKLALLDWLESVHCPMSEKPSYHHLLRAMDRLGEAKDKAEPLIAKCLLEDEAPPDLVFYDITSTYFEGDKSLAEDDFRRYGYSRDHRPDRRQIVIGMVMSRSGIPLCHHVFDGNTVDKTTVAGVVKDLKERFALTRTVFVGDRGMLSDGNLETLLDENLGFIVAHPLRRNALAAEVIGEIGKGLDRTSEQEQFLEQRREGVRFVLAWSPAISREVEQSRTERLQKADAWIKKQTNSLAKPAKRGRKPTVQGTYDRIRDYLRDKNLLSLYELGLADGKVTGKKNQKALAWERTISGMLLLETTDMTLAAEEVVSRYKELAEIERGWRALKSTLLLRPVYHWTEKRILAHVFICVLALQL